MRITEDELELPAGTRLLHIGPQKTGTTALQRTLHRRRADLRKHGVVYPGRGTRPREGVWAALGMQIPYARPNPRIRFWHALVEEVRAAGDQRVCVSTEDFGNADEAGARRVVEELGRGRPRVVAVTRPLRRLLPSQWQQLVKMRLCTLGWEEWLERVLRDDDAACEDPEWRTMWTPHAIGPVVRRWVDALDGDASAFTLVVADESDRAQLARAFERMLALPAGFLAPDPTERANPSLGDGRIEAIRRLNAVYRRRGWTDDPRLDAVQVAATGGFKLAAPWPDEAPLPPFPA